MTCRSDGSEPTPIVIDTREQEPYSFDVARVSVTKRALPVGDYSLIGHENRVAIERKSLVDYVRSVVSDRERFGRELRALAGYDLGLVVVEASLEDVFEHRYRSGVHPNAVLGSTVSIIVDHRVPVYFCGDRQSARRFVQELLCRLHHRELVT